MSWRKRLGLAVIALVAGVAVGNLLFTAILPVPSWLEMAYGATITFAFLGWGLDSQTTD
jgi:hypothetical protein